MRLPDARCKPTYPRPVENSLKCPLLWRFGPLLARFVLKIPDLPACFPPGAAKFIRGRTVMTQHATGLSRRLALRLGVAAGTFIALAAGSQNMRPAGLPDGLQFPSIDGGMIALDALKGRPILVVNTASRCGFTNQLAGLQMLHETYGEAGLFVLAVPSNDFRQELKDAESVKEFCDINYGLTLPMTDITPVRGRKAHPLYKWLAQAHGVRPRWNFHKVLIGADRSAVKDWPAAVRPDAPRLLQAIEQSLAAPV